MELLMMSVSLAAQTWSADPSEASPAPANATQGGEDDQWDPDWRPPDTWYGNIQYLANISIIGAICCLFFFLLVKVRSDHRLPGLASLAAKLLAAWRTTSHQVARLCGANAYQFLAVEGYSFMGFMAIAIFACLLLLPLNLYGGKVLLQDEFLKLTVIHIKRGSFLLWGHFLFTVVVVGVVHLCIQGLEQHLVFTRFHDGQSPDSVASAFTLIIRGVSRTLSVDSRPLQDYFEHHYPGKVFRVIVPPDLSSFLSLKQKLIRVREKLAWLRSATREQEEEGYLSLDDDDDDFYLPTEQESNNRFLSFLNRTWKLADARAKQAWYRLMALVGLSEEERIQKLQAESTSLEGSVFLYKEGRAVGAGIAFVVFKDVYTASQALLDLKDKHHNSSSSNRGGRAELLAELHLGRSKWKVERAPPARDIYWHHLGCSSISRLLRRIMVNIVLLIFLLFCSSPLAAFNALHNAGRLIINPDAMDRFRLWLAWVQSSSWAAAIILQFLPNVLIFVSMYFVIPAVLAYLSSFESHLTVSGEETAVLVKTVSFFLVNLIILRGLLETTLESALLRMGRCYVEGSECEGIWQYMSNSFLANSCLSAMAFLITSSFLGISFDLLAPIPWIRRKLGLSQRQGDNAYGDLFTPHTASEGDLQEALLLSPEDLTSSGLEPLTTESYEEEEEGVGRVGRGLSAYRPPSGAVVVATRHSKAFDYAQYYAFNLSIFAMALIYSTFVPTIVPIGAFYFGYRYIVDKYNFLFVYRVRGFPATNDGKLMGTVLRVMRLCLVLYLLAMLFFFSVRGDKQRLQFLCTLALLVLVIARYGIEKLLFASSAGFNSVSSHGFGSIEDLVEGPLEYEIYSQPDFEWDRPSA